MKGFIGLVILIICFICRAVAARLADPELSLFEALKVGGFEYQDDTEPTASDSENITLGQRKNQLSRRLRLAKKAEGPSMENNAETSLDESSSSTRTKNGTRKSKQRVTSKQTKRTSPEIMTTRKRDPEMSSEILGDTDSKSIEELKDRLSPENHKRRREEQSALAAKYHPDFRHIIIPRGAGGLSFSESSQPRELDRVKDKNKSWVEDQLISNGFSDLRHGQKPRSSMPPPSISNVAIRSLNATAKSVGITLEQLALALSTSKNLMQILSGANSEECDEDTTKKQELALRLHEYETKTLYSRCMLLSGYGHEEASEGNQVQLRFALEAWQKEGKRLQELIRNSTDVICDEAPTGQYQNPVNTMHSIEAARLVSSHSNDHGGDSSQSTQTHLHRSISDSSGRHIHKLEGKCGHRAILHQPKGGTPHIDFVVGDKVECYGDVRPSPDAPNNHWPSQYRCDELDCTTADLCSKARAEDPQSSSGGDGIRSNKAKVLDLSSVDLTTPEWSLDFNDDVLMGLFRLGDKGSDKSSDQSRSSEPQLEPQLPEIVTDDSQSGDTKNSVSMTQDMFKI